MVDLLHHIKKKEEEKSGFSTSILRMLKSDH